MSWRCPQCGQPLWRNYSGVSRAWRSAKETPARTSTRFVFAVLAGQVDYGSAFVFTAVSAAVVALLLIRYVPETRTTT